MEARAGAGLRSHRWQRRSMRGGAAGAVVGSAIGAGAGPSSVRYCVATQPITSPQRTSVQPSPSAEAFCPAPTRTLPSGTQPITPPAKPAPPRSLRQSPCALTRSPPAASMPRGPNVVTARRNAATRKLAVIRRSTRPNRCASGLVIRETVPAGCPVWEPLHGSNVRKDDRIAQKYCPRALRRSDEAR